MGFFWDLRPRGMHSAGCASGSCSLSGWGKDGKVVGSAGPIVLEEKAADVAWSERL